LETVEGTYILLPRKERKDVFVWVMVLQKLGSVC
jgi:hypothetical protein